MKPVDVKSKPVTITLSIRVSDDSFESSFSFPADAGREQINTITKAWIDALQSAVEIGAESKPSEQRSG